MASKIWEDEFIKLLLNVFKYEKEIEQKRTEFCLSFNNQNPYYFFQMIDKCNKGYLNYNDFHLILKAFNMIDFNSTYTNLNIENKSADKSLLIDLSCLSSYELSYYCRQIINIYDRKDKFYLEYKEFLNLTADGQHFTEFIKKREDNTEYNLSENEIRTSFNIFTEILISEISYIKDFYMKVDNLKKFNEFSPYEAFLILDGKDKKKIDIDNLHWYFNKKHKFSLTEKDLTMMLFRLDKDKDGAISYKEFQELFYYSNNKVYNLGLKNIQKETDINDSNSNLKGNINFIPQYNFSYENSKHIDINEEEKDKKNNLNLLNQNSKNEYESDSYKNNNINSKIIEDDLSKFLTNNEINEKNNQCISTKITKNSDLDNNLNIKDINENENQDNKENMILYLNSNTKFEINDNYNYNNKDYSNSQNKISTKNENNSKYEKDIRNNNDSVLNNLKLVREDGFNIIPDVKLSNYSNYILNNNTSKDFNLQKNLESDKILRNEFKPKSNFLKNELAHPSMYENNSTKDNLDEFYLNSSDKNENFLYSKKKIGNQFYKLEKNICNKEHNKYYGINDLHLKLNEGKNNRNYKKENVNDNADDIESNYNTNYNSLKEYYEINKSNNPNIYSKTKFAKESLNKENNKSDKNIYRFDSKNSNNEDVCENELHRNIDKYNNYQTQFNNYDDNLDEDLNKNIEDDNVYKKMFELFKSLQFINKDSYENENLNDSNFQEINDKNYNMKEKEISQYKNINPNAYVKSFYKNEIQKKSLIDYFLSYFIKVVKIESTLNLLKEKLNRNNDFDIYLLFDAFSLSENSDISFFEFQEILYNLNVIYDSSVYKKLFRRFDIDNDGKLNFEEFSYMFNKHVYNKISHRNSNLNTNTVISGETKICLTNYLHVLVESEMEVIKLKNELISNTSLIELFDEIIFQGKFPKNNNSNTKRSFNSKIVRYFKLSYQIFWIKME